MGDMVRRWALRSATVTVCAVLVGCHPAIAPDPEIEVAEVKDPTAGFATYSDEIVGYTVRAPHVLFHGRLEDPTEAATLGPTPTATTKKRKKRKRSKNPTPETSVTVFENLDRGLVLRIVAEPVATTEGDTAQTTRGAVTKAWAHDGFANVSMSGADDSFAAEGTRSAQESQGSLACKTALEKRDEESASPSATSNKSGSTKTSTAAKSSAVKSSTTSGTASATATTAATSTSHSIIDEPGKATSAMSNQTPGVPLMCQEHSRFAKREQVGDYVFLVMAQWPLDAQEEVADEMRAAVESFQADLPEEDPTPEQEGETT